MRSPKPQRFSIRWLYSHHARCGGSLDWVPLISLPYAICGVRLESGSCMHLSEPEVHDERRCQRAHVMSDRDCAQRHAESANQSGHGPAKRPARAQHAPPAFARLPLFTITLRRCELDFLAELRAAKRWVPGPCQATPGTATRRRRHPLFTSLAAILVN